LRCGLERGAPRSEVVTAALLAAASLSVYRMAFAPYLAASLGFVFLGYFVRRRDRQVVAAGSIFAAAFLLFAAPSIFEFARGVGRFVENNVNTPFKESFPFGFPPEVLGLVPRIWGSPVAWILLATLLSLPLVLLGTEVVRRLRPPRGEMLLSGLVLLLVGYILALALPNVPSYVSFKLLSYGAAFLILLIFAPLAVLRSRVVKVILGSCLASLTIASAAVAVVRGSDDSKTADAFSGLATAANALPAGASVSVELTGAWNQSWAIYALRDHPVSVPKPEYILTRVGLARPASYYRHGPTTHVLTRDAVGDVIWQRGHVTLVSRRVISGQSSR
jgi:hypothetical protein